MFSPAPPKDYYYVRLAEGRAVGQPRTMVLALHYARRAGHVRRELTVLLLHTFVGVKLCTLR
jgi:hypothetical protein